MNRKINAIFRESMTNWQEEWNTTSKEQVTKKFFPDVMKRQNMKWIEINHYIVQLVTGHGNFKKKLMTFCLSETNQCLCGDEDGYHHLIYECNMWTEERRILITEIRRNGGIWPTEEEELMTKQAFKALVDYAKTVLKKKEELENSI